MFNRLPGVAPHCPSRLGHPSSRCSSCGRCQKPHENGLWRRTTSLEVQCTCTTNRPGARHSERFNARSTRTAIQPTLTLVATTNDLRSFCCLQCCLHANDKYLCTHLACQTTAGAHCFLVLHLCLPLFLPGPSRNPCPFKYVDSMLSPAHPRPCPA